MRNELIDTITTAFKNKEFLSKQELLDSLEVVYPEVTIKTLSWRIYDLKERGILENPGRGLYRLTKRENFTPVLSDLSFSIASLLEKELPFVDVCIWETNWLNAWMGFQAASNWTLIEGEKDALGAIFNHLNGLSNKVYLMPDRSTMERYVMSENESIIVRPLVSEAPLMLQNKITTAAPEKILVDIVAEPDIFVAQQSELENIFKNIFSQILIHQNRLLRYARRRNKEEQVFQLIPEKHRLKI